MEENDLMKLHVSVICMLRGFILRGIRKEQMGSIDEIVETSLGFKQSSCLF
jgi:hypothetical protein